MLPRLRKIIYNIRGIFFFLKIYLASCPVGPWVIRNSAFFMSSYISCPVQNHFECIMLPFMSCLYKHHIGKSHAAADILHERTLTAEHHFSQYDINGFMTEYWNTMRASISSQSRFWVHRHKQCCVCLDASEICTEMCWKKNVTAAETFMQGVHLLATRRRENA